MSKIDTSIYVLTTWKGISWHRKTILYLKYIGRRILVAKVFAKLL